MNNNLFWQKLWYNLVLPMIIIAFINFLISFLKTWIVDYLSWKGMIKFTLRFIYSLCLGFHKYALGGMWFIYTLVLIKIVYQYVPKRFLILVFVLCLAGTLAYCHYMSSSWRYKYANAIADVMISMPFFLIGNYLQHLKEWLNKEHDNKLLICAMAVSFVIIVMCARINQHVRLYACDYDQSLLLCLIGGVCGTFGIWAIGKLLGSMPQWCFKLANGTIVILGFSGYFIQPLRDLFNLPPRFDFVTSGIILLLFLPIIIFCERYFPYILGIMRVNAVQQKN